MKTTQTKFFETMDVLAEATGFEFFADFAYSNTGLATFCRKTSFAPVVRFHFDFQAGYVGLDWREGFDLTKARYTKAGSDREFILGPKIDFEDLDKAIAYVADALDAFTPAEKGRKVHRA